MRLCSGRLLVHISSDYSKNFISGKSFMPTNPSHFDLEVGR
ncbi:hypothetical protein [Staphylococcus xylosus]|nr:hypothetical protein [Staphylococcus xylosus]